jgi:hypothetical protein
VIQRAAGTVGQRQRQGSTVRYILYAYDF